MFTYQIHVAVVVLGEQVEAGKVSKAVVKAAPNLPMFGNVKWFYNVNVLSPIAVILSGGYVPVAISPSPLLPPVEAI